VEHAAAAGSNPNTCKHSDGSCCWKCCCGKSPSPSPPGPPPPPPAPPPAPPPRPGNLTDYCPDTAKDFKTDYGHPQRKGSGWYTKGGGRVSSLASYNLAGGFVEFDMDLTHAIGGINTNVYATYPPDGHTYCDSNRLKHGCAEFDWTENNGHCHQATTWHHNRQGHDHGGQAHQGPLHPKVHVKVSWSDDGQHSNVYIGNNHFQGEGFADVMTKYGLKIYSSQWKGWVPGYCHGSGNLQASSYRVANLTIRGRIVQGPEPTKCNTTSSSQPLTANIVFV